MEPVHGHNWSVKVTAAADELDAMEVVMDFHVLEKAVDDLIATVNNGDLNHLPPFAAAGTGANALAVNPSAERVAWWIGTEVAPQLPVHVRLLSVEIGEAPGCLATYRPNRR